MRKLLVSAGHNGGEIKLTVEVVDSVEADELKKKLKKEYVFWSYIACDEDILKKRLNVQENKSDKTIMMADILVNPERLEEYEDELSESELMYVREKLLTRVIA